MGYENRQRGTAGIEIAGALTAVEAEGQVDGEGRGKKAKGGIWPSQNPLRQIVSGHRFLYISIINHPDN